MPMNALELNTCSQGFKQAKELLALIKPVLDGLNITYDSAGGVKETVTQADLDEVPSFSGITKVQLDDGFYVLTATVRTALQEGYTQLAHLAARG